MRVTIRCWEPLSLVSVTTTAGMCRSRAEAGQPEWFGEDDLYTDVRPALSALRGMNVWVGIVGNQTVRAGGLLRGLKLSTDIVATSDDSGVSKPDLAFFEKVIE